MTGVIIAYLICLLLIGAFGIAGIYHARRFGFAGDKTTVAAGMYIVAFLAIVVLTFLTLGQVSLSGGS